MTEEAPPLPVPETATTDAPAQPVDEMKTAKKPRKKKVVADPTTPDAPPVAAAKKKKKKTKEELLVEWVRHREEGKRHYEAAEAAFNELMKKVKVGKTVTHPVTGEEFTMTDNFATKNVSFRPCGVNRLELKPVKGTKRTPAPDEVPPESPPA